MGGANKPQQQTFDPTPPALQPLRAMLAQGFMSQLNSPRQNRTGQMPPMMSIFDQLFGGGAGMGSSMGATVPFRNPNQVASGSRMMHSAPGGNLPTLSQFLRGG